MRPISDNLSFQYKYKPLIFSQMYGVDYLSKQFQSITQNKRYNAFLFSGLNGHGKTTLAEIYLRRFFCKNPNRLDACLQCDNCISIQQDGIQSDVYRLKGKELCHNAIVSIEKFCYYVPSKLNKKVIFIDDLDLAEPSSLEALIGISDGYTEYAMLIFTVTTLGKIPLPLIQRSKVLPVLKPDRVSLVSLISYVCSEEGIKIQEEEGVNQLITLSDQTPRIILNVLEIIKEESGILSKKNLETPIVNYNLQLLTGKYY